MPPVFQPAVRLVILLAASLGGIAACPGADQAPVGTRIVAAARAQVGITMQYDPAYVRLRYPGGDVPAATGVCSDVVVRALRTVGLDLQQAVHEDMAAHFRDYPQKWGLKQPDKNIDHRRVPNLMRYFERHQVALPGQLQLAAAYAPGDIVAWDLGGGILHVGVVSDRKVQEVPLIIHNIGAGAREEDVLFRHRVIGHYRLKAMARGDGPANGNPRPRVGA